MANAGRCVVIADADPGSRLRLVRRFSDAGFLVYAPEDMQKVMALLPSIRADVVLLDLALPSYQQLRWLVRQARVIVMTTPAASELARVIVKEGAIDFLVKPVDPVQAERSVLWHLERTADPGAGRRTQPRAPVAAPEEHRRSSGWLGWTLIAGSIAVLLGLSIAVHFTVGSPPLQREPQVAESAPPANAPAPRPHAAKEPATEPSPEPEPQSEFRIKAPPLPSANDLFGGPRKDAGQSQGSDGPSAP